MTTRLLILLIALSCSALVQGQEGEIAAPQGQASEAEKGHDIVAIAGAAGNGVFVADERKGLTFLVPEKVPDKPRKLRLRGAAVDGIAPLGMAYDSPNLYVYDEMSRRVVRYNPRSTEKLHEPLDGTLENPSHIAVSPQGLVAVLNGGELSFHQVGHPPTTFFGRRFPDASGLAFTSWSSLIVMSDEELVRLEMTRQKDGTVEFAGLTTEHVETPEGMEWEAMDVHEGVLHLATNRQIYARVDGDLIPILPQNVRFDDLDDFAIVRDAAYVLDDDDLYVTARAVPVDLILEGSAAEGQAALLDMYTYLASRDLLPIRTVSTLRPELGAPLAWFEAGALISPTVRTIRTEVSDYPQTASAHNTTRDLCEALRGRRALSWVTSACKRVPEQLGGRALLSVPDVRIERMLSQREVTLADNASFTKYLAANLPSEELRQRVSLEMMRTLNPDLTLTADFAKELAGNVVAPSEVWSVTVAVPTTEFRNQGSQLWSLANRHPTLTILSRSAFVEQSAQSLRLQDEAAAEGTAAVSTSTSCTKLRAAQRELWDHIGYPYRVDQDGRMVATSDVTRSVRIGLVENDIVTRQEHFVFSRTPSTPVWYGMGPDLTFKIEPVAGEAEPETPALEGVPYTINTHHGTHIAALLAARPGPCWSGLLPLGELVLIDLGADHDTAKLYRNVISALDRNVRVFNVSHQWETGRDDLYAAIKRKHRSFFVVGAGNDGKDFDRMTTTNKPVMAAWNHLPNVVSVTASKWNGELLQRGATPAKGDANYGRQNVDLIAPGQNLVSATEAGGFAKGSGTSQSVPLVAAAAALLTEPNGAALRPGDAKARLIATSSWRPEYENKVWGGGLNFAAAVKNAGKHVISTVTAHANGIERTIELKNDPDVYLSVRGRDYPRDPATAGEAPDRIPFSSVLSIQRGARDLVRIVYKDANDRLRIILDATLDEDSTERLVCSSYLRVDAATNTLLDESDKCNTEGILVSSVHSYVRGGPYYVTWGAVSE